MAKVPNGVETLPKISTAWGARALQIDDRRQTDGRQHIANVNMSSRSLKNLMKALLIFVEDGITKKAQREKPLIKTRMLTFKVLIPNLMVAKPYAVIDPWQIQSHGFRRNKDDVSQIAF